MRLFIMGVWRQWNSQLVFSAFDEYEEGSSALFFMWRLNIDQLATQVQTPQIAPPLPATTAITDVAHIDGARAGGDGGRSFPNTTLRSISTRTALPTSAACPVPTHHTRRGPSSAVVRSAVPHAIV